MLLFYYALGKGKETQISRQVPTTSAYSTQTIRTKSCTFIVEAESSRILLSTFWLYLYHNVLPFFFFLNENSRFLPERLLYFVWTSYLEIKVLMVHLECLHLDSLTNYHLLHIANTLLKYSYTHLHDSFQDDHQRSFPNPLLTLPGLFPPLPFILDASLNVKAGFPTTTPSTKPYPRKLSTPFSYRNAGGRWHILDSGYSFVLYTLQLCEFNVITD